MSTVALILGKTESSAERVAHLRAAGFDALHAPPSQATLRSLRDAPPAAFVIDLSRSPSQGRDIGLWMRSTKALRHVPLIFVGGAEDRVAGVRELLPDATYTTWDAIGTDLARAIAEPPAEPVVPDSQLAGYAGTPLPRKLGVKPGMTVRLVDAPDGFEAVLGTLPDGATIERRDEPGDGLILWFVRTRAELTGGVAAMADRVSAAGMWIVWPKKASGVASDLSQRAVRETGLAAGLVDYKVCSVDATWSGLRFARRR